MVGVSRPDALIVYNACWGSGLTTACTRLCSSLRSSQSG
ncbi:MAG: hypothetical protein ANABAC_1353 [Anaerolineae bacterium]|nr:MAG: hypothetical protein ANABAC_1353 [Anaerolineae bacterium]